MKAQEREFCCLFRALDRHGNSRPLARNKRIVHAAKFKRFGGRGRPGCHISNVRRVIKEFFNPNTDLLL